MLEIDKNTVAEAAENTENIAAETAETDIAAGADIVTDDADDADKSKFAVAFGKGKEFMTRHGHIWQVVKFTLISLIAFIAEFASMYALQYGLEGVLGNREFHWFISTTPPAERARSARRASSQCWCRSA